MVREGEMMRRMLTIKAKPGMVVAGDVYTEDNKLVITKGTVLDSEIIDKLKYYSIFDFFCGGGQRDNIL